MISCLPGDQSLPQADKDLTGCDLKGSVLI
jgi:hypothetical protein